MHASIKEKASKSKDGGPIPPPKKKDYMGENISTTPDFTEKVHLWVTGVRPNGPRINSEESHPLVCDALGLKCSSPTPFFYMNSSKTMTGHRPLTSG